MELWRRFELVHNTNAAKGFAIAVGGPHLQAAIRKAAAHRKIYRQILPRSRRAHSEVENGSDALSAGTPRGQKAQNTLRKHIFFRRPKSICKRGFHDFSEPGLGRRDMDSPSTRNVLTG